MRQPFRRTSVYLHLLLITEAVIGLLILVVTAYYHSVFTRYLSEIECRLIYGYMCGIYVFGAQLVVTFLCSIAMWRRIWRRRCTPNIRLLLSVWALYSCVIIASGFGCVWNLYRGVDVLENAADTSLTRGIDMYYTCPEWKLLWDGLQWHKECCGVHGYKDWMNAEWMPRRENNCSSMVLAPFACCKRSCDSCFNNFLPGEGQPIGSRQPFPALTVDSIHANGCLPLFVSAVWNFFYILLALWVLALKFLIMLCCMTKFIVHRQNEGDGCDNVGLTDDDGHPLVVVKYPCNVRCVTIAEDDLVSDNVPETNYCDCTDLNDEQCGY